MRAVVTAGGTSEPIDDVRVITNFSTGRFGAAIANALARRGHEVVLLAGKALAARPERVDPKVRLVPFGSFADLDRALSQATSPPPDLLFMAAAVSDFSPDRTHGKIRSDRDELVLVLRRNPKLVAALRDRCPQAYLVGFKLLSGVSAQELEQVARRLMTDNRLDLCVANDLQLLAGEAHPVVLVTPEGGAVRRTGTKEVVADLLVDLVVRRAQARPLPAGEALAVPEVHSVRRLPDAVVLPTARAAFPWPPDTVEERVEVEQALAQAAWDGRWAGGPFAVRLEPGALVGAGPEFDLEVERHRREALASLRSHGLEATEAVPVIEDGRPVGAAAQAAEGLYAWLEHPDERREDRLLEALAELGRPVLGVPGVRWSEHGWIPRGAAGALAVLEPPSEAGRVEAASVCLLDPVRRRVLIGLRRTPPWEGFWAFPGGRRQPGESLLATGLRELEEETGIRIVDPRPVRERKVFVGTNPGYVVTNFVVPVLAAHLPIASDELEARWVEVGSVTALRPMAGGTRLVLAGIDRMRW